MHHEVVANRFEFKREERTAFAFASGQIAGGCLDGGLQRKVQLLRLRALRPHHNGERVVELRDTQWTFRRR
jgi:hypothetical protein